MRTAALLLAAVFLLSSVTAFAAEAGETFPEGNEVSLEEDVSLDIGPEGLYPEEEDGGSPVLEDEEELGSVEITEVEDVQSEPIDDTELGMGEIDTGSTPESVSEDEELGAAMPSEEEFIEQGETEPFGEEPEEGEEEELQGLPKVSLSSSAVSFQSGGSSTVKVNVSGYPLKGLISASVSSNKISTSWGSYSGGYPLTIRGSSPGTYYVTVTYMTYYTRIKLASATIKVSVLSPPALYVSASSLSVKAGNAQKLTFTVANTNGYVYLSSSLNNSCCGTTWGSSWYSGGTKIDMTVTGKSAGTSTLTVYMKRSGTGQTLATVRVTVTVTQATKLTVSSSSVTFQQGKSYTVNLYPSGFSSIYFTYGRSSSNVSATYGSWNGTYLPMTIRSSTAGSYSVTAYMYDYHTNKLLNSVTVRVTVTQSPKVTASVSSATVNSGSSIKVNITYSGASGNVQLYYGRSSSMYTDIKWGSWSGTTIPLTITGKNAGTTTFTIYLYVNGSSVASTSFTVTTKAVASPTLSVSSSSMSLNAGDSARQTVYFKNVSEACWIAYSLSSGCPVTCTWDSSCTGDHIGLTVKGTSAGSGTVYVYLKRKSDNRELVRTSFSVTVKNKVTKEQELSFKFGNFSEAASLSLCKYMYGNTQYAQTIYDKKIGAGGNCYGFTATEGMLYKRSGVYPGMFNSSATYTSQLSDSNKSSALNLTAREFIKAMQISWSSPKTICNYSDTASGMSKLASTVRSENNSGRPVSIIMNGYYSGKKCGHAILAYGVESSSSYDCLLCIDSNRPLQTSRLYLYKNGSAYTKWKYNLSGSVYWGTDYSGHYLGYVTYGSYKDVWDHRGGLTLTNANLLSANSADLTIRDVHDNVVARVQNGELTTDRDDITFIRPINTQPYGGSQGTLLYLPIALYTVENHDAGLDQFELTLCNADLGTKVKTTADSVTLCADDSCDLATALLFDAQGESYEISLNSSREGEPATLSWSGTAQDEVLSVSLDGGELEVCNLSMDDLSMGEVNGSRDQVYAIATEETENGRIECSDTSLAYEGESRTFTFIPDSGYSVKDVIVDGTSAGPVSSYTFRNIRDNHSLQVLFEKVTKLPAPVLTSVMNTESGVKIAWGRVEGADQYRVFYKTENSGWKKAADTAETSLVWKNAVSGTGYTFTVRCLKADGVTFNSDFDSVGKTITYVAAPSIKNLAVEGSSITMNWDASAGASSYRIFFKTNGGTWKKLADTASASYTWTGPVNGNTYAFTVRCLGADGKGFVSGYDNTGKSILFQSVPQISSAVSTAEGIKLSWKAFEGAGTYRIFYKEGSGSWKKLADTAAASYVWTGAESGKTYSFTLRGMNAAGTSYTTGYDNTGKSVIYIAAPKVSSVTNTTEGVKIAWTRSEGAAAYRIFYKTNGGTWKKLADVTGTSYVFKDAVSAAKYAFTVRCLNAAGTGFTSGYDNAGKEITYIAAPLVKSAAKSGSGVVISWDAVPGAQGYRIFYKVNGGSWKKLADTKEAGYTWTGAQSGNTYGFTVRCTDGGSVFTSGYDNTGVSITVN